MINVSEAWKATHKELLLPETFIKISYAMTDPELQINKTEGTDEEEFSKTSSLTNGEDKSPERYASLEWNGWGLDGSFEYFDGTPVDPGYTTKAISSDDSGYEGRPPSISIGLLRGDGELVPGITIVWSSAYGEWASHFRVTAYGVGGIISQVEVTDNTNITSRVLMDGLKSFREIQIDVLKWSHPNHRCRVEEVFIGIQETYTKANLLGFTHSNSADLLSAALPKNEITFKLDNSDGRWNPYNPTGMEQYLLERQEVVVRYGMMVGDAQEWIKAGTFWLSEWDVSSNGIEASFTARDSISFMNETYTGLRDGFLYDIALSAFNQANLPSMSDGSSRFKIDDSLRMIYANFDDDTSEYKIADVLQMVAHAGCCVLYQDRDGVLHIEPRKTDVTDYVIDSDMSYSYPNITISKPLKAVSVKYGDVAIYDAVSVGAKGEVQTVDNPLITVDYAAEAVASATKRLLAGRTTVSGEFRADPRLDALDVVTVTDKYGSKNVAITSIEYTTTGGAMRGRYEGRVVV